MAAARPLPDQPRPDAAAEQLRRQRLVRELSRDVGRFLLDAARAHPPPWPGGPVGERDPTEDPEAPALVRKRRRVRRQERS